METTQLSLTEWADALPPDGFEVFHAPSALRPLAEHAPGDLRLYAGYKGDRVVGLFPLFVETRAVGTAALSPPPGFGVPRLGPLVMPASPKRRKQEKVNAAFAESVLADLDVDDAFTLFRAICPTSYPDPRPFVWSSLSLETSFTYHLDVTGDPDSLLAACSKSLRREIRDADDAGVEVVASDEEADVRRVYEQTRARYEEQDRGFALNWPYVRDLTRSLRDDDRCRTYVAVAPDGEYLSGVVVLYSNDAAYFWLGGSRGTYEGTSVNSRIHWRIVEDIAAGVPRDTLTTYDLMGANTERLCRYKSKFDAALVPYYTLESAGAGMRAAKTAYRLVNR